MRVAALRGHLPGKRGTRRSAAISANRAGAACTKVLATAFFERTLFNYVGIVGVLFQAQASRAWRQRRQRAPKDFLIANITINRGSGFEAFGC